MGYLRPESAIRKLLKDSAGVVATLASDQVVCPLGAAPRNALYPHIQYQRLSAQPMHYLGGVSSSGLWMGRSEYTVFADTADAAIATADAMRTALDGAEPVTVTIGSDSVTFERLFLSNEDEEVFDPADASDTRVFTITQEYEWSARP